MRLACTLIFILSALIADAQLIDQPNRCMLMLRENRYSTNPDPLINTLTGEPAIDALLERCDVSSMRRMAIRTHDIFVIELQHGEQLDSLIAALNTLPEVAIAERDAIGYGAGMMMEFPNDEYHFRQWGLYNTGSFGLSPAVAGADIDMHDAWDIEQGDSNVIIAIMDSGCRLSHPDLAGRFWENPEEIINNGEDDDGNGLIDDIVGWDFVNGDNQPLDDLGHGTNVTGIIAANGNNEIGYAGVDWHCKLMILKGIDADNFGYYSWWIEAIYYAREHGADVINLSVGGVSSSSMMKQATDDAIASGMVVVASMMNSNSSIRYYPAANPGVIAVGSTNADDTRSEPFFWDPQSGSSYGDHISVSAPGNYVYGLDYESDTNYNTYWGGTSQAAPHVSGLAALLLAQDPGRSPAEVRDLIEAGAEDLVGDPSEDTEGWDQYYGYGRVNAYQSLATGVTGIADDRTSGNTFKIYPNPCSDFIEVSRGGEFSGQAQLQVLDQLGRVVLTAVIRNPESITLAELPPGIFTYLIMTDEPTTDRGMLVKVE